MQTASLTTCTRQLTRATRPGAFVRSARPLAIRASREAELAQMAEFKKGLSQKLEEAKKPGATAAAAGDAVTATTEAAPLPGKKLKEVNKDTFDAEIAAHGSKLIVVDCFTEWCGPCKMILPTLMLWAEELEDKIEIIKFNCNKENKELGMRLGIKVAPTFILFKDGKEVAKMTGAKTPELRALIEEHM